MFKIERFYCSYKLIRRDILVQDLNTDLDSMITLYNNSLFESENVSKWILNNFR